MLRLWDFRCDDCGTAHRDWPCEGKVPQTIVCPKCEGTATWATQRQNQIHLTHAGRKYGMFDPQFGCVVEDYSHKKKLLKERGMVERPPESLEEIREGTPPPQIGRNPDVLAADSVEEIMGQIDTAQVDWRKTGDLRRGDRQDAGPEGWGL